MNAHAGKRVPRPSPTSAPYWEGCRNGRLMIQRCDDCCQHQFYPRNVCSACMGTNLTWTRATGRGTVRSFTVIRHPVSKAYAAEVPYVLALVRLEEGPTMMTSLVDCAPEEARIGLPVEVVFEQWSEEVTMPKFRPVPED